MQLSASFLGPAHQAAAQTLALVIRMHPQQPHVQLSPVCGGDNPSRDATRFDEDGLHRGNRSDGRRAGVVIIQTVFDLGQLVFGRVSDKFHGRCRPDS